MRTVALNRHTLPFALALIAGALFIPVPVHGVTLGNVASLSPLGHPLRVVIPVALSSGEALNIACVKLVADNNAVGPPQIVTGRVSLEQASSGPRLVIASRTSVSEPALRLAVQVGCGSTTRRDYVLFLDPPNSESATVLASADTEEPSWTHVTRERVAAAPPLPRQAVAVASPLPPTTWGTPVPTSPVIAEARPKAADKTAPEAKPEAMVAAAPAAPRELITLSSVSGGGSFISEAGASSLTPVTSVPRTASLQSYPLTGQGSWRSQPQPQSVSVWQVMWPYVFVIFGTTILGLIASVLYRRHTVKTSWMDPKSRTSLRGETQAGAAQPTLAHFGAMSETGQKSRRAPTKLPPIPEPSAEVSELDTLLQDIQADMIDERTIKDAWKSAAGDSPTDMGRESILKAIAAAERDLQIGAPEPMQVALDKALDNDLMTIPNVPKGVRFG